MDFDEYQKRTADTAIYPKDQGLYYTALGLAGEVGEICNQVKKIIRDDNNELYSDRRKALFSECGDACYYLFRFMDELGYDASDVAQYNLEKLEDRKKRGVIKGSGDNR